MRHARYVTILLVVTITAAFITACNDDTTSSEQTGLTDTERMVCQTALEDVRPRIDSADLSNRQADDRDTPLGCTSLETLVEYNEEEQTIYQVELALIPSDGTDARLPVMVYDEPGAEPRWRADVEDDSFASFVDTQFPIQVQQFAGLTDELSTSTQPAMDEQVLSDSEVEELLAESSSDTVSPRSLLGRSADDLEGCRDTWQSNEHIDERIMECVDFDGAEWMSDATRVIVYFDDDGLVTALTSTRAKRNRFESFESDGRRMASYFTHRCQTGFFEGHEGAFDCDDYSVLFSGTESQVNLAYFRDPQTSLAVVLELNEINSQGRHREYVVDSIDRYALF